MKTGVIGLGAMGRYMAINLHQAGHLQSVWNRTVNKAQTVAADTGCQVADSIGQLSETCDLIITCVSRDSDVLEVIDAITERVRQDTIIVDTSTVSSSTATLAAERLLTKKAGFLDAPVSGGVEGARQGTLAMMIGGDEQVLQRARPTLSAIATNIVYMGSTGSGQATKAVNQHMAAGINQAVTGALAFGRSLGLDMERVVDVVSSGACGNWFLQHRGKTMLADIFEPGFKVGLHHKDLEIVRAMAGDGAKPAMALVDMTLADYQQLMDTGHGDEDISALFRLKQF